MSGRRKERGKDQPSGLMNRNGQRERERDRESETAWPQATKEEQEEESQIVKVTDTFWLAGAQ